jgi:lipid-A-disaccharide synthase
MHTLFKEPTRRPDVLIIAGEHSGDEHAAKLAKELLEKDSTLHICAFAGPNCNTDGIELIYDMMPHAVVGLVEVIRHWGTFRRLMGTCVDWIAKHQPRAVVLVDYPGFNLRLAERLKNRKISIKGGGHVGVYGYIAPQVWAWKAHRRFTMAKVLDGLAVILPFEKAHFKDTSLPVEFVGHPLAHEEPTVHYDPLGDIILLPGSRAEAVYKIFPRMMEAFSMLLKDHPMLRAYVMYPSEFIKKELQDVLEELSAEIQGAVTLIPCTESVGARAVLTSSGTMSVRTALAGIPGAIVYVANPLTYLIGRCIIKVRYLGLASIVLNEKVYPEYIQWAATPTALALDLAQCIRSGSRRNKIVEQAQRLSDSLSPAKYLTPGSWLYRCINS